MLTFILLCVIAASGYSNTISTADDALQALLDESVILDFQSKIILVSKDAAKAGQTISTARGEVITAGSEGWFFFVDDHPIANWDHPCRYIFISRSGNVEIVDATSFPADFDSFRYIDTEQYRQMMRVENRYPTRTIFGGGEDFVVGEKWALLVNGGYAQYMNHIRYWNDLSNIYCTLVDVYGFEDDHIWVLCSDGLDPAVDQSNGTNSPPDLDGDHDDDIMGPATLNYVEATLDTLSQLVGEDDLFLYFNTDHGTSNSGWSVYVNLWSQQQLQDWHFAEMMDEFPQCQQVFCFEQCYSGGFEDDLMRENTMLRNFNSACTAFQSSYAMAGLQYDEFVFDWTAALRGEDAYGVPVNADYNGDGMVSLYEAFIYAERNDVQNEQPQYASNPWAFGNYDTMDGLMEFSNMKCRDEIIDDDNLGASSGNGDGVINPGETIELAFELKNSGSLDLTGLTGLLETSDPNATVIDNESAFPDMGLLGGGTCEANPFVVAISETCPGGHILPFTMTITDVNDSTWTFEVELTCMTDGIDGFGLNGGTIPTRSGISASPNPFNNHSVIKYSLPEAGNVSLKVFDSLGREIAELVNGFIPAGEYSTVFNASNLSSGIYFFRLEHGNEVSMAKSLLIK